MYVQVMIKKFLEWIGLKEKLHSKMHDPPYVSEGEIWWASIGENIGSEISGKSDRFSRPVIILKKLTRSFYFVVPTTTQQRTGSWYVRFKQGDKNNTACLHQAKPMDYRRFFSKLGKIDNEDYKKIQEGFYRLYL